MHQTCWPTHPNSQNFLRGTSLLRRLVMWFLVVGAVAVAPPASLGRQDSAGNSQGATPPGQSQSPDQKPALDPNQQNIPDAPSTVQPPAALPQLPATPGPEEQRPEQQQPAPAPQ